MDQLKQLNDRIVSRVNVNLSEFDFDTEGFVTNALDYEKMLKFYAFYGITSHHPIYFHFKNSNVAGSYFLGKCYVGRSAIYKSDIRGDELKRRGDNIRCAKNIPLVEDEMITIRDSLLYNTLVQQGEFREDLYYRLKVFPIYLPLLNNRKEDIPLLVNHFITINNRQTRNKVKGISRSALRSIMDYPWPGNVRELANAIEHAFVLCSGREIDITDLPLEIRSFNSVMPDNEQIEPQTSLPLIRPTLSKKNLIELLTECEWNKAEVARRTGFSRASIWKYMKKWNIPLQSGPKHEQN